MFLLMLDFWGKWQKSLESEDFWEFLNSMRLSSSRAKSPITFTISGRAKTF